MGWLSIGDWAEEEEQRQRQIRRARLKIAAEHFGKDVLDIIGDREIEDQLLARYEATGRPWPKTQEEEEDE